MRKVIFSAHDGAAHGDERDALPETAAHCGPNGQPSRAMLAMPV